MKAKCCTNGFCMSCAEPYQKAGFETDEMYQEYLRNRENHKKSMAEKGRGEYKIEKTRSKRLQDIINKAIKSKNYEDHEEEQRRLRERVLYR